HAEARRHCGGAGDPQRRGKDRRGAGPHCRAHRRRGRRDARGGAGGRDRCGGREAGRAGPAPPDSLRGAGGLIGPAAGPGRLIPVADRSLASGGDSRYKDRGGAPAARRACGGGKMAYLPLMQQRLVEGMRRYRRRFDTLAGPLGRLGTLEVRLARSVEEVKRAQRLRYRVFYEEMSAVTNMRTLVSGRDRDPFDRFCDHLLVIDHGEDGQTPEIVGTYRLLRQEVAQQNRGFYSSGEFELDKLVKRHPDRNFLELGRSCVLPPYRTKRTVELLWHGIWAYVRRHNIDVMVG